MKALKEINFKENEHKALRELKEQLLTRFPTAKIILYGSKTRGDFDKESDIDVLVLLENDVDTALEEEIINLAYDIELEYDVVFGLLIESKTFWDSDLANAMPIHWNIDREGIGV